jgi:DNA mismatch repair protein MutH
MASLYNVNDKSSVLSHAKQLIGHKLRDFLTTSDIDELNLNLTNNGNKGRFGHKLEKYFFRYEINSSSDADFPCGLELKVTPLKKLQNGKLSPKERLVCNIINYIDVINEEWETSSFLEKNNDILLIRYIDPMNRSISQLDYQIVDVRIHSLINSTDYAQFEQDWKYIVQKIKEGNAHLLSESDTKFLGACTKGANQSSLRQQPNSPKLAMQRAFSFKAQYMKLLLERAPEIYDALKN